MLRQNAGSPFDILTILAAVGVAADSNPQLAISLESEGKVAFFNFQLYSKDLAAACTHYLVSLEPILARPAQPFHDPAECDRREIAAVNAFLPRATPSRRPTRRHRLDQELRKCATRTQCFPTRRRRAAARRTDEPIRT